MIKLFSLKQQSKDGLNPQSSKKTSAAYLRVQKGRQYYTIHESKLLACSNVDSCYSRVTFITLNFIRYHAVPSIHVLEPPLTSQILNS